MFFYFKFPIRVLKVKVKSTIGTVMVKLKVPLVQAISLPDCAMLRKHKTALLQYLNFESGSAAKRGNTWLQGRCQYFLCTCRCHAVDVQTFKVQPS